MRSGSDFVAMPFVITCNVHIDYFLSVFVSFTVPILYISRLTQTRGKLHKYQLTDLYNMSVD
nr:MAG TPA: hypothetical protein [Caudoviricetes sp.]